VKYAHNVIVVIIAMMAISTPFFYFMGNSKLTSFIFRFPRILREEMRLVECTHKGWLNVSDNILEEKESDEIEEKQKQQSAVAAAAAQQSAVAAAAAAAVAAAAAAAEETEEDDKKGAATVQEEDEAG